LAPSYSEVCDKSVTHPQQSRHIEGRRNFRTFEMDSAGRRIGLCPGL